MIIVTQFGNAGYKKAGMKMTQTDLDLIAESYQKALFLPKRRKNETLVSLMNQLEHRYSTFIINPIGEDLEREEVRLYKEISNARDFS